MAHPYLSDPLEGTWEQPEHEAFANLAERIDDMLQAQVDYTHNFDSESVACLMGECRGECLIRTMACLDCGSFEVDCDRNHNLPF